MKIGPDKYLKRNLGHYVVYFRSIEVIGDDIDYEDSFLIKIAQFIDLPIDNIHNKEDLVSLIDNHIKYNPSRTINDGYEQARDDFNHTSQDL